MHLWWTISLRSRILQWGAGMLFQIFNILLSQRKICTLNQLSEDYSVDSLYLDNLDCMEEHPPFFQAGDLYQSAY